MNQYACSEVSSLETLPVAVIGGGIAGATAAVQLRRMGADPLLFEPGPVGGLLHHASRMDNYPGFPGGIAGPALAERLAAQVRRFKVRTVRVRVERLSWAGGAGRFRLQTEAGPFGAGRVIVATGTRPRPFPPAEKAPHRARGRVFDSVVPLRGRRGLRLAVIGGSDAAFDYALALAMGNRVTILMRSAHPRANAALRAAVAGHPRVTLLPEAAVRSFSAGRGCLRIEGRRSGTPFVLEADAAVTAVGRDPETGFLSPSVRSRLTVLQGSGRLWLAGDVVRGRLRQASIAAGDGMRAAMELWDCMDHGSGEHEVRG
jgi:thioredoxin reductase (NADPH)